MKTERVRKPYTSMKPESSAKSLEVGTEAEGKDGETWIVKSFTGAKGTRHAWVRKSSSAKGETKQNNTSKTTTTEINIDTSKGITADTTAILSQLNVAKIVIPINSKPKKSHKFKTKKNPINSKPKNPHLTLPAFLTIYPIQLQPNIQGKTGNIPPFFY